MKCYYFIGKSRKVTEASTKIFDAHCDPKSTTETK